MSQDEYLPEAIPGGGIDEETPFIARFDNLLLLEEKMVAGGLPADIARHKDGLSDPAGRRYVEGAFHRGVQGGPAEGPHDARRAQNREAADNSQPGVEGLFGQLPATGNGYSHEH